MRRFGTVLAVFVLVIILVVTEIVIIRSASKYEPKIGVVFAKIRIPEQTVITPEMLEIRNVDISYAHRMSIRNVSDAVSKTAAIDIEAGEMILSGRLDNGKKEFADVSDAGKKLFSIEFKGDQANGWWLATGQKVDIIYIPEEKPAAVHGPQDGGDSKDTAASAKIENLNSKIRVLKDIRVAAVIDENGNLLKNSGRITVPRFISFEVTDEQAGVLAYAKGHGRIELSVSPNK